ncbi:hypothetical protein CCHR01_05226 [Colletotrichum chrysophilum]|uniref:Uncharacterized protein n=1 Tax=Colletotrichum chrysophilum TaxID=1836956 RepID=A0AAD9AS62_9PEZI|nr:hypothetical protein CCHR01_05226 [Colletotrichum chrysophilum]
MAMLALAAVHMHTGPGSLLVGFPSITSAFVSSVWTGLPRQRDDCHWADNAPSVLLCTYVQ